MNAKFEVLSIVGSPITRKSNTRALIEDFVNELSKNGVDLEHEIISLGRLEVKPCRGCLNCTYNRPCPIKDDLLEIKQKMITCDMLILGSPVYLNHVSAQMKALFDRLFTWCQNYPLLGKYSLSAVTSDNDGQKETAAFIEKMLAAYGTSSFGSIGNIEVFIPGFIPGRGLTKTHNQKLARKVSRIIREGIIPPSSFMTKELENSKETAE
jgi:multimeric flavodoxin WrbA